MWLFPCIARQSRLLRAAACTAIAAALLTTVACAQEEHSEFVEVVGVLQEDFVDRDKLSAEEMERAAIDGLLEYLDDPYTAYLPPERYAAFAHSFYDQGPDFEGIGASVTESNGQIIVLGTLPGSPAFDAGLMPGDILVGVDGVSIADLTLDEAVARIRGPKDTLVVLSISRSGVSIPIEIPIRRSTITASSIHTQLLPSGFGYIRLATFDAAAGAGMRDAVADLRALGAEGLSLDLRNNGGGLVTAAVEVVSEFVAEGVVLRWVDADGEETVERVSGEGSAYDIPLVVLVNGFSASASEVVAGALQDHGRARIVGGRTFGKGAVNMLYELGSGAGLNLTIARWLTPNGRMIEGSGIEPDISVGPTVNTRTHARISELTRSLCTAYAEEAGDSSLDEPDALADALDALCNLRPEGVVPIPYSDEQLDAAVAELERMTNP